jgi:RNA polymerase sigma-70 factor (ECF subfamily)
MTAKMKRDKITEFFSKEYQKLVKYVNRLIDETADRDAEDIVQDVAVNLFNQADIAIPIENLSAYVYRSLKNRIVDIFRGKKPVIHLDADNNQANQLTLANIIYESKNEMASVMEKQEMYSQLYQAINALNEKDRAIVVASEIQGHSFRTLSERWGVPIGTLLARKSRALKKLSKKLKDWKIK